MPLIRPGRRKNTHCIHDFVQDYSIWASKCNMRPPHKELDDKNIRLHRGKGGELCSPFPHDLQILQTACVWHTSRSVLPGLADYLKEKCHRVGREEQVP